VALHARIAGGVAEALHGVRAVGVLEALHAGGRAGVAYGANRAIGGSTARGRSTVGGIPTDAIRGAGSCIGWAIGVEDAGGTRGVGTACDADGGAGSVRGAVVVVGAVIADHATAAGARVGVAALGPWAVKVAPALDAVAVANGSAGVQRDAIGVGPAIRAVVVDTEGASAVGHAILVDQALEAESLGRGACIDVADRTRCCRSARVTQRRAVWDAGSEVIVDLVAELAGTRGIRVAPAVPRVDQASGGVAPAARVVAADAVPSAGVARLVGGAIRVLATEPTLSLVAPWVAVGAVSRSTAAAVACT
jgi:hypothetical protein